jgi:hypothetical protein
MGKRMGNEFGNPNRASKMSRRPPNRHYSTLRRARSQSPMQKLLQAKQQGEGMLLIGWPAIARAIGLGSTKTARAWARRYQLPYIRMANKPVILREMLREWLRALFRIVLKIPKKEGD